MIMRKILSLITVIALFSPLANVVSGCSEKKEPPIPLYPIENPIKENKIIPAIIIPDIKVKFAEKLVIDYSPQKKFLDDPSHASKTDPLIINIAGRKQMPPSDWKSDLVTSTLNQEWSNMGGLVESLIPYVSYKPVTIIYNKPTLSEMYLPILGFTKDHPRPFYIEGD